MKYIFEDKLNEEMIKLRTEVFVLEQGFEEDFSDQNYIYYSAYKDNELIASLRAIIENNVMTIGRVCVKKSYRGLNIGSELIKLMEEKAHELNVVKIIISSQRTATNFYLRLNYQKIDEYLTQNVLHDKLVKKLV